MVSKPITACSVTRWVSTPHGMKCPQRTKAVSAARPIERGIKATQPDVVVRLIVKAYESLRAVRIGEDPGAKPLLDALLLVAGGQGLFLIEHALFLAIPLEDV